NANRSLVENKRVILVDDSIVRGTTAIKIVQMIRDAGASEVHMRIGSPPITHPDYYGLDTPVEKDLLAANNSLVDMCNYIGADSIAFLSIDGLYKAMGHKNGRDSINPAYTDHCFTGDYPTQLRDQKDDNHIRQLSLLS
ncbi:MAG: amidophosphoribosyltransferase, partial [Gammaproteobacteria bacterium]|nr:amidophosphoribosyltransferase [Gammaproteobacteria bacterium]